MAITDIMSNLTIIIAAVIIFAIAIIYAKNKGLLNQNTKKTSVLMIRPGYRALLIPVKREYSLGLECEKVAKTERHFYKSSPGYEHPKGTLFIAVEGRGYSRSILDGKEVEVPISEALKTLIGDKDYNKMTDELKRKIEESKIGVTITPDKISPIDPELPPISEEDLNSRDQKTIESGIKESIQEKQPINWSQVIAAGTLLGFIVYILCAFHVLPVPGVMS